MVIGGIVLLSLFYYQSQEKLMLAEKRATLSNYAYIQTKRLKVLHHYFDERREYPRNKDFKSAIYDIEYMKIFSLLQHEPEQLNQEIYITKDQKYIHFIKSLDEYYLGTKYLIIEVEDNGVWRTQTWRHILGYGSFAFILFLLFGLYLTKLFLKPMRDSILLLDRFIKDTTHELNTPLSAILANIEMMDTSMMIEKNKKRLNRINIAAKTVSTLYKDLTYITLEQDKEGTPEEIALKPMLLDRVEYFDILAKSKQIQFVLELEDSFLTMDREKFIRVVDNLISNAIKYNKRGGKIMICLTSHTLSIEDTGVGIAQSEIPFIFDRYMRFNKSEGGFGVGLSIVKNILSESPLEIAVFSELHKGTKMVLTW